MNVKSKVTCTLRRNLAGAPFEVKLKAGEVVSLPDQLAKQLLATGYVEEIEAPKVEPKVEPKKPEKKQEPVKFDNFEEEFDALR